MDTNDETLKSAIRESLEARGILQQMRAKMRAEIFTALDDQAPLRPISEQSDENQLINDCIRQYLEYNGYQSTLTVFNSETAGAAKGREFSKSKRHRAMQQILWQQWEEYQKEYLGTDSNLPALYSILSFIPSDSPVTRPDIHTANNQPSADPVDENNGIASGGSESFESYHSDENDGLK